MDRQKLFLRILTALAVCINVLCALILNDYGPFGISTSPPYALGLATGNTAMWLLTVVALKFMNLVGRLRDDVMENEGGRSRPDIPKTTLAVMFLLGAITAASVFAHDVSDTYAHAIFVEFVRGAVHGIIYLTGFSLITYGGISVVWGKRR